MSTSKRFPSSSVFTFHCYYFSVIILLLPLTNYLLDTVHLTSIGKVYDGSGVSGNHRVLMYSKRTTQLQTDQETFIYTSETGRPDGQPDKERKGGKRQELKAEGHRALLLNLSSPRHSGLARLSRSFEPIQRYSY